MSNKHLTPQPVVVVEPRHEPMVAAGMFAGRFAAGIAATFLLALIAWWLGPLVFPEHYDLTYWQTFALIFLLRALVPRTAGFRYQSNLTQATPR